MENSINPLLQIMIDKGVPRDNIELLLMFPIIIIIIVFFRQVIGLKAFGIYTPALVSVAFLATGLKYGIFLFCLILIVSTLIRLLFKNSHLLYFPRTAIMLSIVSLVILFCLGISATLKRTGLASTSIFAILILITVIEKFIVVQIEKGLKTAFYLSFFTLGLAAICYFIANFNPLRHLLLHYPYLIILVILINFLLGKWTGLRLVEYYRFREIIKKFD